MFNLKLQVICENSNIEFFNEGIVGDYYHTGKPTKDNLKPEYIIKVFFDDAGEFKGIFLSDDYKEELQDEFESLIHCSIPRILEEYESLNLIKVKDNKINFEPYDFCRCVKCGKVHVWEDSQIWGCEHCGMYICADCINEYDNEMLYDEARTILCDTCFKEKQIFNKEARIKQIIEELNSSDVDEFYDNEDIEAFLIEKEILENELLKLRNC